jgi:frataxin-like iron-binding protein CyaY
MAYSYVKQFEVLRDGCEAMLALKLQFGDKAYIISQSKAANAIVLAATFNGPTWQYAYDQHLARFNDAFNELKLVGIPSRIMLRSSSSATSCRKRSCPSRR